MKDIKTKKTERAPRIRNAASRMPKELAKSALLQAKEKSRQAAHTSQTDAGQESPTDYASGKIRSSEEWAVDKGTRMASAGGRILARKVAEKLRTKKQEQAVRKMAAQAGEEAAGTAAGTAGQTSSGFTADGTTAGEPVTQGRELAVRKARDTNAKGKIKTRPKAKEQIRTADKRTIKEASRAVKPAEAAQSKAMQAQNLAAQRKQAKQSMKAAKRMATESAKAVQTTTKAGKETGKVTSRAAAAAAKAVASTVRALAALGAVGAALLLALVIIVGIIAGAAFSGSDSTSAEPLSAEVLAYTSTIQKYANQYGIPEYVASLQAIMMQESGGRGTDPMQSSECPYNTRYPNNPNAIQDADYSIQVGVQYYASCVQEADCTSPQDMSRLQLSWQGYNYGNGYISWAIQNYGGYSAENALLFSQQQAASHGWARYGDPEYVPHVQRYYSGDGGLFAGLFGNEQIVSVAKMQLGNAGGQKFWSWYGFEGRVAWCACFVSWCADQCGLIESGNVVSFALCDTGIAWFKSQGKWQERGYTPTAGTYIFFDWDGDGSSDHVGIVEKCENGRIYTVEGNSGDAVREQNYSTGDTTIMGFGVIGY